MAYTDSPRKDTYLRIDGKIFYVIDRMLKTQGRQGGLIILKLRALESGNNQEVTVKSGTKVEEIETETKEVQYLYSDSDSAYFMDTITFETVAIPLKTLGDYVYFLKEAERALILTFEGQVINIRKKGSVDLLVTEAEDAVRGNTATNATKQATVETGYKVNVPLFVKKGDLITINTETGQYTGRANK